MSKPDPVPQEVYAQYRLSDARSKPWPGTWQTGRFTVSAADERYIVNVARGPDAFERLQADQALAACLFAQQLPVLLPEEAAGGQTWVEVGGAFYEIYRWPPGEIFEHGNRQQIAAAGQLVGRYQVLAAACEPPYRKLPAWGEPSLKAYLNVRKYAAPRLKELLARRLIDRRQERAVLAVVHQLAERTRPFEAEPALVEQTVHGALDPDHIHFDSEGGVLSLLPSPESASFVRVFDVAIALLRFAGRRADALVPGQVGGLLAWPRVESFVQGFREHILLNEAEAGLLPWLLLVIRVYDALSFSVPRRYDYRQELLLTIELHKWLEKNAETLAELFCDEQMAS